MVVVSVARTARDAPAIPTPVRAHLHRGGPAVGTQTFRCETARDGATPRPLRCAPSMQEGPGHPHSSVPAEVRTAITAAAEARSPSLGSLIRAHYPELRAIAQRLRGGEAAHHSLKPTDIVHEAFVRLVDQPRITRDGSSFFRACFAQECRRVLVDHARARAAERRGGKVHRTSLDDHSGIGRAGGAGALDVLDLHQAMEGLAAHDERMAKIAEMRVFGEMTVPECAEALGVSPRTVDSDWAFARAWLQQRLR
jgi:RNA polymerase sigma-70 factor (ECF subfamily)